ncbi:MAG TPA: DUF5996 family protein [Sphingomicrobium sp.]|nr:DUF5996 family protein [Sphingomicrobium sp.]
MRAGCRACPTASPANATATRNRARDSGRGAVAAEPFFYSYVYPEPDGFRAAAVAHGRFDEGYGEFVLPYAEVRAASDPERMLGEFLQSTYDPAADLAHWDRAALERAPVAP